MSSREFSTDAEVADLVTGFENATLAASEFTHHAHIAVALSYMDRLPPAEALDRMRQKIRAFAHHHGAENLYHETLTIFWMRLLGHLGAVYNVDLPLWQRINFITRRWGTRQPIDAHYSPELIRSQAAREGWLPPDRLPLPF
jgi:hypothetical protein